MLKIKKKLVEFENQEISIVVINFGISLYAWAGRHPNINSLSVTFPVLVSFGFLSHAITLNSKNTRDESDNFASSSLLGEDELCTSISSYLCK